MWEGHTDVANAVRVGVPDGGLNHPAPPRAGWPAGRGPQRHSVTWMTRRVLLVVWDAVGWALSLALASTLHDEFDVEGVDRPAMLGVLGVAVAAQLLIGAVLQTYRGRRPIGGVDEAINVAATTFLTGVAVFLVDFFAEPHPVPRSVPLLAVPFAVLVAVGSSLAVRLYRERRDRAD